MTIISGSCPVPSKQTKTVYTDNSSMSRTPPPVQDLSKPPQQCNVPASENLAECWPLCWAFNWNISKKYLHTSDHVHTVNHNDVVYVCLKTHIASGDSEPGIGANWETYWVGSKGEDGYGLGFDWKGAWATAVEYKTGNIPAKTNYSVVTHIIKTDDPTWITATSYIVGNKVYGSNNTHYTCKLNHTSGSVTEPGVGAGWATYWDATPLNKLPVASFVCKLNHNSSTADSEPVVGANWMNYWDPLQISGGQLVGDGLFFQGKWEDSKAYKINDTIEHKSSAYVCVQAHTSKQTSNDKNAPGNEPSLILIEQEAGILQKAYNKVVNWIKRDYNDPTGYWKLLAKGEDKSAGLLGGAYDWLNKLLPREVTDVLLGVGLGYGINYIANKFTETDVKEYEARFDGDYGYATSFTNPGLKSIIEQICIQAGINYDVSLLSNDTKVSFAIGAHSEYGKILDTLAYAFQIDIINTFDSGARLIKFKPRSTSPVRTLYLKDLGFSSNLTGDSKIKTKRIQGNDLPRSVEISYFSKKFSEKLLTQSSIMRTYSQGQNFKVDLPISLDDGYARDLCDVILMNAHLERNEYVFITSLDHIDLEAGDIIELESIGNVRITQVQTFEQEDGMIQFNATDSGITTSYRGSITGTVGTGPQPVVPTAQEQMKVLSQSNAIPLDLPAINSNDKNTRMHFAVYSLDQQSAFPGARVYISRDNGTTYSYVGTAYNQSTWGIVPNAILPIVNYNKVDTDTVITVTLKRGSLVSAADDKAFFNGINKCMVGKEMIYFKNVTKISDYVYEISHLLRGRRGTDVYTSNHDDDEAFVLIDDTLLEVPLEQLDFKRTIKFKVQTIGLDPNTTTSDFFTINFLNFKGWSVANGVIDFDADEDAFTGFWTRRYKWDPEMVNGRSSLPDEDMGGYKVLILDPSDNSVKREIVVTDPQFVYTADQQIQDFGILQTTLKVSVVVMSKTIGPGHPIILTYGI